MQLLWASPRLPKCCLVSKVQASQAPACFWRQVRFLLCMLIGLKLLFLVCAPARPCHSNPYALHRQSMVPNPPAAFSLLLLSLLLLCLMPRPCILQMLPGLQPSVCSLLNSPLTYSVGRPKASQQSCTGFPCPHLSERYRPEIAVSVPEVGSSHTMC